MLTSSFRYAHKYLVRWLPGYPPSHRIWWHKPVTKNALDRKLSSIILKNISKRFTSVSGKTVEAIRDVSLDVNANEFLTIVGTSGCGKSTLLQLIAGIEKPTSGTLEIIGNGDGSEPRLGFVFQNNTVFPWRTVKDNLAYALEVKGVSRAQRESEAAQLCELVGLDPARFLHKYPKELSGGETRRVAIGMAFAYQSNILLLDEPTSQLDYITRLSMQQTVQKIWMERPFTVVYVTHDIEESVFLGDRVLLMENGLVKGALAIDLRRPRDKHTLDDPRFLKYRDDILEKFEE